VQLSDRERRAWLRLARTQNVGPVTFRHLISRFGSASVALEELARHASRGGNGRSDGGNFVLPPEEDSVRELEALAKLGGRLIATCEADFPPGLKALEAPPPVFSALGIRICCKRKWSPSSVRATHRRWRANSPTSWRANWALPGWW
jgi:DNA processing protein